MLRILARNPESYDFGVKSNQNIGSSVPEAEKDDVLLG